MGINNQKISESGAANAKHAIPWIIAIALFMETLDITIIITAIPKIAQSFGVDPIRLKVALTSYLLSLAFFIPVSGWVADKWGTQRTFIFALAVFTLGSIWCGRAVGLSELVIARVLQGIGGAFMMPVGRLILLRTFPMSEMVRAMNFMTMPALLGPVLGPLAGGFITTYYSWPWIFYVNVPIGILGILCTLRFIKNKKSKSLRPFDTWGFLLFGLSLSGTFFAFESVAEQTIPTYAIALILTSAILGFLVFYRHYQKTQNPILNLKLFSIRPFSVAAAGTLWIRLGVSGVSFLVPLLLQLGYGLSPFHSGLLTASWALGMICVRLFNKAIYRRFGFKKVLLATSILNGIAISSFALITEVDVPLIIALYLIGGILASLQLGEQICCIMQIWIKRI